MPRWVTKKGVKRRRCGTRSRTGANCRTLTAACKRSDCRTGRVSVELVSEFLDALSELPLTPAVFHILLALADEERHGYGIMQDVARQTDGALQLGPGTLYGCLKRMQAAGLVEESDERPDPSLDDERRRYYRMTALGRRTVHAEARRLSGAVSAARTKLAGGMA
jgi:DNA-binding PadR family transcriptional regulator